MRTVVKKRVWTRACDSFDSVEKAAEALSRRVGHETMKLAMANTPTCGCSKGLLFEVEVRVKKVSPGDDDNEVE